MDALILGGGYGTRLFGRYNPKTYLPKGLVNVGSKLCIEQVIETFSDSLLDRIILETNNEGKPFYENWVKTYRYKNKIEIFVEPISTPQDCLGVLETIQYVSENYKFKNPILILSPDNLFTRNQDGLIIGYKGGVRIANYTFPTLECVKKYGVVTLNSERVVSCVEKPSNPQSATIRTSCEIWNQKIFTLLSEWNEKFDSDKVGDFINYLINKKVNMDSYQVEGLWIDIGNPEDLQRARGTFQ